MTTLQCVCFIGVGLIGGSLARAMRERGLAKRYIGCSRSAENLELAKSLGVIDDYATQIQEAVADADFIVIATPLGAMPKVFAELKQHAKSDAIITDVGSAKASVVAAARAVYGELPGTLVPGHPIAGTENSGVEASFAELFRDRRVILTPLDTSSAEVVRRVREVWSAVGASVSEMSVEHHDEVLAATSHLPHVVAFSLVDTLAKMAEHQEIFEYAAGGFRDFTRIASSDPVMWRDICLDNRTAVLHMIRAFSADLQELADAIESNQEDKILEVFARAKKARDGHQFD